jgi:hypothetical protein
MIPSMALGQKQMLQRVGIGITHLQQPSQVHTPRLLGKVLLENLLNSYILCYLFILWYWGWNSEPYAC